MAFRSQTRPSSVVDAKASTVGPLYLGRTKMLVLAMQFSRISVSPVETEPGAQRCPRRRTGRGQEGAHLQSGIEDGTVFEDRTSRGKETYDR